MKIKLRDSITEKEFGTLTFGGKTMTIKEEYENFRNSELRSRLKGDIYEVESDTTAWEYEKEIRLLIQIREIPINVTSPNEEFLYIRLKNKFFKGMKIKLSPWDDDTSEEIVNKIIRNSDLPKEIKDSIQILPSDEKGMFD